MCVAFCTTHVPLCVCVACAVCVFFLVLMDCLAFSSAKLQCPFPSVSPSHLSLFLLLFRHHLLQVGQRYPGLVDDFVVGEVHRTNRNHGPLKLAIVAEEEHGFRLKATFKCTRQDVRFMALVVVSLRNTGCGRGKRSAYYKKASRRCETEVGRNRKRDEK